MAIDIAQPMRFRVDLQSGLIEQPQRSVLMRGDKNANRIVVELTDGAKAADLTGLSASGKFSRPPEGNEVLLAGEISGNVVSVTLTDECYAYDGRYELSVLLSSATAYRTILLISGYVSRTGSGEYIDGSAVIPNINDLLEIASDARKAVEDAANAASAARDAANNISIKVLGQYDTVAKLRAAHPTGNPGDAYAVGESEPYAAYIWDADKASWKNIGQIDINGVGRASMFKSLTRKVLAMSGGLYHLKREHDDLREDVDNYRICKVIDAGNNAVKIKMLRSGCTVYLHRDTSEGNCAISQINDYAFEFDSVFNSKKMGTVTLHKLIIDGVEHDSLDVFSEGMTFLNTQIVSHSTVNAGDDPGDGVTIVNITPDGFSVCENRGGAKGFIRNKSGTNGIQEIATIGDTYMFSLDNGKGNIAFITETVRVNYSTGTTVNGVYKKFSFEGV